jgi:hypothetical protein
MAQGITLREYMAEVEARRQRQLRSAQDMACQFQSELNQLDASRQQQANAVFHDNVYSGMTTASTGVGMTLSALLAQATAVAQQRPKPGEEDMTRLDRFKIELCRLELALLNCASQYEVPIRCQINALNRLIRQLEFGALVRDLVYTDPQRVATCSFDHYRIAELNTWACNRVDSTPPSEFWKNPKYLNVDEDGEPKSNKFMSAWASILEQLKKLIFIDKENHGNTGTVPKGTAEAAASATEAKA